MDTWVEFLYTISYDSIMRAQDFVYFMAMNTSDKISIFRRCVKNSNLFPNVTKPI